jgi:hypothetical protein
VHARALPCVNFCRWAELESGATAIAFTPLHQRETDARSGEVQLPDSSAAERGSLEVCFAYADVDAAYKRAGGQALGAEVRVRPGHGRQRRAHRELRARVVIAFGYIDRSAFPICCRAPYGRILHVYQK